MLVESDEGAAQLFQPREGALWRRIGFSIQPGSDGFPSQAQQLLLFLTAQLIAFCGRLLCLLWRSRLFGIQCCGAISHHPVMISGGHISGVGILEDLDPIGPQSLSRHHHHHHRLGGTHGAVEIRNTHFQPTSLMVSQRSGIKGFHHLEGFPIHPAGLVILRIMRHVGAGHQQHPTLPPSLGRLDDRLGQGFQLL
jgi:hypothetical protein